MQLPLLFERECLLLAGRLNGRRKLNKFSFLAVVGTIVVCLFQTAYPPREGGEFLFSALFVVISIGLLSVGLGLGNELVEHRRNKMLGLLIMTPTRPTALFLAQLGSRVALAVYGALALLPCFAISLLYGGITWERCVAAGLFFVVEVLFLVSFEFVGAAITTDSGAAGIISNIVRAVLLLWPWGLDRLAALLTGTLLPHWIYFFSPLSAFLKVYADFANRADFLDFLLTLALSSVISLLSLVACGWILSHTWREDDEVLRKFRPVRASREWLQWSGRRWARQIRPRLETDPLMWQAALAQPSIRWAWATVIIMGMLWLAGLFAWRKEWLLPGMSYLSAGAIIFGVRLQILLGAAMRTSAMRECGYYEFLLSSGQTPEEIIRAEQEGLYLRFREISKTVRIITILLLLIPLLTRDWDVWKLVEHLTISVVLFWASRLRPHMSLANTIWISLNTAAGVSALFQTSWGGMAYFTYNFYRLLSVGLGELARFPSGEPMEVFFVFFFAILFVVWMASSPFQGRSKVALITTNFRQIVQSPLPSKKEIGGWDRAKPLASIDA